MSPTNNPDFQHGYTSGREGVSREAYEGFLSSQVNTDWLQERIQETRTTLDATEQQITETTDANRTAFAHLQTHALQVERLTKGLNQYEALKKELEADRDTLRIRRAKAAPEYSLLAGLLFLVAGVSFLAGDLIISHEIVAYALNIRNTDEAWAFAVGLSMVSILLKPAYDRLIEQPYQENPVQNGRQYSRFKISLAVFAVLTLAVLGWFRYEAYRTDQLKAAINKSIRQLQFATDPTAATQVLSPATLTKIEQQLAQSSELNLALVNSPWALLSFVLSGILFALAGAVCLGIALPVLSAFWFRWLQADRKLWTIRRRIKRLNQAMAPLDLQVTEQRTQQAILQHNYDLLPDLTQLQARRQGLSSTMENLVAELKLAQTDSRISNFNDGYEQGEAARLSDTEIAPSSLRNESASNGQTTRRPSPRTQAKAEDLRPHQLIRKWLLDDL